MPTERLEQTPVAQVVCAGWADDQVRHPCGKVLGQTLGKGTSHGVCSSCFFQQLRYMGKSDQFIQSELARVFGETPAN